MNTLTDAAEEQHIKQIKTVPHVDKIVNYIFLGNEISALSNKFLIENDIKFIINCTRDVPLKFNKKIDYFRVPLDDSLKQKDIDLMTHFIPLIVQILEKNVKNKINTLVHCHAGMQRSAIIVAAYILKDKKLNSHKDALEFVIKKRVIAFFNGKSVNFEQSIIKYNKSLNSTN